MPEGASDGTLDGPGDGIRDMVSGSNTVGSNESVGNWLADGCVLGTKEMVGTSVGSALGSVVGTFEIVGSELGWTEGT